MVEHSAGFIIIALSIGVLVLFIFGDDLDLEDKVEIMGVFTIFLIGITIGVYLMGVEK